MYHFSGYVDQERCYAVEMEEAYSSETLHVSTKLRAVTCQNTVNFISRETLPITCGIQSVGVLIHLHC